MDKEEYKSKLKTIAAEAHKKEQQLRREFALSNSTVKCGDTAEDHIGKIIVEKIRISLGGTDVPTCVYYGEELTKAGVPFKKSKKRGAWQCNLRT